MEKVYFDGAGAVVGRLGSLVAKELLKGKSVVVINSEKAVISGKREDIVRKIRILRQKGSSSQKGPKISKLPDRLLKRMIRGMLPWDKQRGKQAYKRLRCYVGEIEITDEEKKKTKKIEWEKPFKSAKLEDVVRYLG